MYYMRLYVIILAIFLITSCSKEVNEQNLMGTWQVVKMNVHIKDIPQVLVDEGRKMALSTVYSFKDNDIYNVTIKDPSSEVDIRETGKFTITNKIITFQPDSLFFKKDGNWKFRKKDDFISSYYLKKKMAVKDLSSGSLTLSKKEHKGYLDFKLDRKTN